LDLLNSVSRETSKSGHSAAMSAVGDESSVHEGSRTSALDQWKPFSPARRIDRAE
jgi:hypothetical protein